ADPRGDHLTIAGPNKLREEAIGACESNECQSTVFLRGYFEQTRECYERNVRQLAEHFHGSPNPHRRGVRADYSSPSRMSSSGGARRQSCSLRCPSGYGLPVLFKISVAVEGPEIENRLCSRIRPTHSGLLKTLLDDMADSGLYGSGADRKIVGYRPLVVQPAYGALAVPY